MILTVTDRAAAKLKALLAAEKKGPDVGLRVGVTGGGCSGLQYLMDLDTARQDDHVIEKDGVKVLIDPKSAQLVTGSELDFSEGLMGSGFKLQNPQVKGTCGCGQSFQV